MNIKLKTKKKSNLKSSYFFTELWNFLETKSNIEIVLPIEKHMLITFPLTMDQNVIKNYNVFPNKCVYIGRICPNVRIISSLQKPKKIELLGTDGKNYCFLLKPKDDLRKDFRLMEFNAVFKHFLCTDTDARKRRLTIRTYAVLPLNDECGIIEWVENLVSYRTSVISLYKLYGKGLPVNVIKSNYCNKTDSVEKKKEHLLKKLLPSHPSIFGEWFKYNFSDPHSWYNARNSFTKTLAVMSIVGYILGLGDRHGTIVQNLEYKTYFNIYTFFCSVTQETIYFWILQMVILCM